MMIRHEGDGEDVKHREDVLCLQSVVLHDAGKVVDQKFHEGLDVHVVGAIERGAGREQRGQLAPTGLIGNLDYNFKISTQGGGTPKNQPPWSQRWRSPQQEQCCTLVQLCPARP